ncbi:hypothetical protein [Haloarcula brevis]|uniref:hypothetical protein n=1 Tax=Haloarcula brevis TaxID=3111453 RepID=UPI00300EAE64
MHTIGPICVGYIGTDFLDRLRAADPDVVVFDIAGEAVACATDRGASAADNPSTVAERTHACKDHAAALLRYWRTLNAAEVRFE